MKTLMKKKIIIVLLIIIAIISVISLGNKKENNLTKKEQEKTILLEEKAITTDEKKACFTSDKTNIYAYMYHYIRDKSWDKKNADFINNVVYSDDFKAQMQAFEKLQKEKKLQTALVSEIEKYKSENCFPSANMVVLISDDWWDDNYTRLFSTAKGFEIKFNLAIISGYTKKKWERYYNFMLENEVLEVSDHKNFEILSHTVSHPDLRYLSQESLEKQLCESKSFLENLTWKEIKSLVYPAWKYNTNIINTLQKCWYNSAFTTIPWYDSAKNTFENPFEIKRIRVWKHSTVESLVKYFK